MIFPDGDVQKAVKLTRYISSFPKNFGDIQSHGVIPDYKAIVAAVEIIMMKPSVILVHCFILVVAQHYETADADHFHHLVDAAQRIERMIQGVAAMHNIKRVGFEEAAQLLRSRECRRNWRS